MASGGNYVVYGASYPDNSPVTDSSFIIKVEVDIKDGRNIQTVKTLSEPVKTYVRRSKNTGWAQWEKLAVAGVDTVRGTQWQDIYVHQSDKFYLLFPELPSGSVARAGLIISTAGVYTFKCYNSALSSTSSDMTITYIETKHYEHE